MRHFDKKHSDTFGAEHLADIYGTEKDKVNCPFYWKIGACRHGERCTRLHNKPTFSQTLLLPHMYANPITTPMFDAQGNQVQYDDQYLKEHFEEFYEDVFEELSKYGTIEELNVCNNICDHLVGNVYIKFSTEEEAQKAQQKLAGRYYAGRIIMPEFSPVTDFREARCRQFETGECGRGGLCNFMHLKKVSSGLMRKLYGDRRRRYGKHYSSRKYRRSRSRSRERDSKKYRSKDRKYSSSSHRRHRDEKKKRGRSEERDYVDTKKPKQEITQQVILQSSLKIDSQTDNQQLQKLDLNVPAIY